ncbi:LemA family protein [Pseudonocardia sp. TRM90224]|uniref:LemA family protein n=1 Tax=Pseudonocardia sp. TRM90224 TaxID=2812678 RepID=UPI001E345AF2|nr:LemA family protein [Pseudonocardia sp. TRM90224]
MSSAGWLLVAAFAATLVATAALAVARARRLDRLHVRVDAAREALEAALRRRSLAALHVATTQLEGPADALRAAATVTSVTDREAAENTLGRLLAAVDRAALPAALRGELVEAEQLLVLARRVYNDAVRDTLGLRSRRMVRLLRLAGTAPMPAYFEIAEPEGAVSLAETAKVPPAG